MPRPPRIDFPDAVYHVTSRGNGHADIFLCDEDRARFLTQLAHHLRQCGVTLYAFALMQNHVHLLCRTPRANLSRFMQRLLSSYALYSRYKHRRPGHLFQGRFKAKLVEDDVYLLAVRDRYIHLNPVKIAACRRMSRLSENAAKAIYHVEGQAIATMIRDQLTNSVLHINYGTGPCDLCISGIPELMNEGMSLWVVFKDGVGFFTSSGWTLVI
jgi:putative transposase